MDVRKVYMAHRCGGAEGGDLKELIGVYFDAEMASEIVRGQNEWGPNSNGRVVERLAVVHSEVGPNRNSFVYPLDPAYAEAGPYKVNDADGRLELRNRVLRRMTEAERVAIGFGGWQDSPPKEGG